MHDARNGMPASDLPDVTWRKSARSNSQGTCVELASLPGPGLILPAASALPATARR